ncbi:hypothetical protein Baya_11731 [Bagarius yarrelli]|uniref:Uncharacterized protein n=1 Tax=Bagarius yarrelli TaxID=175774 RepID=A0A556V1E0_BAGYA|nr:hypothetical protein Baya_11731 [Bagarius yarrelli]
MTPNARSSPTVSSSAPNPDGYLPFKLTTVVDHPITHPAAPFAPTYPEAPMPNQGEMYPPVLYNNSMTPEAQTNMELEEILSNLNSEL